MRILIVEDDPKLRKSLVHIFEHNHYAVDSVDNGTDALEYASTGEYDGLVLDIMMPRLDGVTVLQKLRTAGITTPALFLTARTEGALTLNRSTYELQHGDRLLSLSGREFQVMEMLMCNPNQILSPEQLITHIWGWNTDVDTSVIWVHISNIRKKIDTLGAPVSIRFVRNAGYVLEAQL